MGKQCQEPVYQKIPLAINLNHISDSYPNEKVGRFAVPSHLQGSRLDVHPLGRQEGFLDAGGDVQHLAILREMLSGTIDQDLAATGDFRVATKVGQDDSATIRDNEGGHDHGIAFQGWGDGT